MLAYTFAFTLIALGLTLADLRISTKGSRAPCVSLEFAMAHILSPIFLGVLQA